ncbi:MAG: ATPase [Chitinophagaceae bacterium]|nr:MAG: ATPase [Chitinophagaceae bacterium]
MQPDQLVVKTQIQISKLPELVYEAIVDPRHMSNYFIAESSGRMVAGASLEWRFPEFDLRIPVRVGEVRSGEYVSFFWDDEDGTVLTVEILLHPVGSATHVIVTEKSREANAVGIAWLARNTEGWANFLACMKAYLEYGINLRKGAFDFMKAPPAST